MIREDIQHLVEPLLLELPLTCNILLPQDPPLHRLPDRRAQHLVRRGHQDSHHAPSLLHRAARRGHLLHLLFLLLRGSAALPAAAPSALPLRDGSLSAPPAPPPLITDLVRRPEHIALLRGSFFLLLLLPLALSELLLSASLHTAGGGERGLQLCCHCSASIRSWGTGGGGSSLPRPTCDRGLSLLGLSGLLGLVLGLQREREVGHGGEGERGVGRVVGVPEQ